MREPVLEPQTHRRTKKKLGWKKKHGRAKFEALELGREEAKLRQQKLADFSQRRERSE